MNKTIKKQLDKVQVAHLGTYDDSTTEIIIPKFEQVKFDVDCYYLVKLDDTLLNPNDNELLVSNWNKGTYPRCKYLKIDVIKVLGKMICVNSLGYDYDTNEDLNYCWNGWLPIQQIEMIQKL